MAVEARKKVLAELEPKRAAEDAGARRVARKVIWGLRGTSKLHKLGGASAEESVVMVVEYY